MKKKKKRDERSNASWDDEFNDSYLSIPSWRIVIVYEEEEDDDDTKVKKVLRF